MRIKLSNGHMESSLKEEGIATLININLVFIPLLHDNHYYVLCFNLKKAKVEVIDNLGNDEKFDKKYGGRLEIMVRM